MENIFKTPFEMKREVKSYILLKSNSLKIGLYYLSCIVSMMLSYLLVNTNQNIRKYLYDITDKIEEATHVFLILENDTKLIIKIKKQDVKTVPYITPHKAYVVKYANRRFYYAKETNDFRLIGNSFLNYNNDHPSAFEDFNSPLDEQEYQKLFSFYGENRFKVKEETLLQTILDFFTIPVNLFNLIAIIYMLTYEIQYAFAFKLSFYIIVMILGRRHETKKEQRNMKEMCSKTQEVTVYRKREGRIVKLTVTDNKLTVGDIVEVKAKRIVNFDCVLVSGCCMVNQSTITGESIPIIKKKVEPNNQIKEFNRVFSGSYCIQLKTSKVFGVVSAVGFDSFQGNLISVMNTKKLAPFRFFEDLLLIFTTVLALSLTYLITLMFNEWSIGYFSPKRALFLFVQICLQAFPLAIYFCLFLTERVVAYELKKNNIKKASSDYIVKAGRMNTVCFDKTGTLTEDRMMIDGIVSVNDLGFSTIAKNKDEIDKRTRKIIIELTACCHSLDYINGDHIGDPLEKEIFNFSQFSFQKEMMDDESDQGSNLSESYFMEKELYNEVKDVILKPNQLFIDEYNENSDLTYKIAKYVHFDSIRKRMSVVVQKSNNQKKMVVYTKGAPEIMTKLCKASSLPSTYETEIDYYSKMGFRVLSMAYKEIDEIPKNNKKETDIEQLESDLTFLGLLVFINPLKEGVKKTIRDLHLNDILPIMITGDAVNTAINVGYSSGIIKSHKRVWLGQINIKSKSLDWYETSINDFLDEKHYVVDNDNLSVSQVSAELVISTNKFAIIDNIKEKLDICDKREHVLAFDGETIEFIVNNFANNDKFLERVFKSAVIYGRANPFQKKIVVRCLKKLLKNNDFTIGFIGDGANDAEALHEADVGLSLGNQLSSMVASYYTDEDKIDKIKTLSIEGKYSLTTSIEMLYFMLYVNIIEIIAILLVGTYSLNFTGYEFFMKVFYYGPVYIIISLTGSSKKMTYHYPKASFLNKSVFKPFIISMGAGIILMILLYQIINLDINFKNAFEVVYNMSVLDLNKHFFAANKIITIFWFLNLNYLLWAVAIDYPFKKKLSTNKVAIAYCLLFVLYNSSKFIDSKGTMPNFEYFMVYWVQWPSLQSIFRWKILSFMFVASFSLIFCFKSTISFFWTKEMLKKKKHMEERSVFNLKI